MFAKGEIVEGVAMLVGSVAGGYLAQATNLGVPYMLRAVVLALTFVVALMLMRDIGFTPKRGVRFGSEVKSLLRGSIAYGLGNPAVRPMMLANVFTDGVSIFAFYAMQPYLLELYGNPHAYGIAGLAAAIVGGAQIGGGLIVPHLGRVFHRRTTVLLTSVALSTAVLALIGLTPHFWTTIGLLVLWGLLGSMVMPVRQSYVNELVPSEHRATVLSFDSLMGSSGGVASQPVLGRIADAGGYPLSYLASAAIQAFAIPCMVLAQRQRASSDPIADANARAR